MGYKPSGSTDPRPGLIKKDRSVCAAVFGGAPSQAKKVSYQQGKEEVEAFAYFIGFCMIMEKALLICFINSGLLWCLEVETRHLLIRSMKSQVTGPFLPAFVDIQVPCPYV